MLRKPARLRAVEGAAAETEDKDFVRDAQWTLIRVVVGLHQPEVHVQNLGRQPEAERAAAKLLPLRSPNAFVVIQHLIDRPPKHEPRAPNVGGILTFVPRPIEQHHETTGLREGGRNVYVRHLANLILGPPRSALRSGWATLGVTSPPKTTATNLEESPLSRLGSFALAARLPQPELLGPTRRSSCVAVRRDVHSPVSSPPCAHSCDGLPGRPR